MQPLYLKYFINANTYPFYIHTCTHEDNYVIHTHEDFNELVIVLNGSAMHVVDQEQFLIKKGDVFVISDNISHGYKDTHEFEICNIMFQPDNIFKQLGDIRKIPGFHALFVIEPYLANQQGFSSHLTLSMEDFLTVTQLIDALMNEYNNEPNGSHDMIHALFTLLSIFLSRKYDTNKEVNECSFFNLANATSFMESNYTQVITMDTLASVAGLSTRHFNRLFKETYGIPPVKYLFNLRINHAYYLLKKTTKSITEIAILSGFQDINYFSRAFKKATHLCPTDYRKMNSEQFK